MELNILTHWGTNKTERRGSSRIALLQAVRLAADGMQILTASQGTKSERLPSLSLSFLMCNRETHLPQQRVRVGEISELLSGSCTETEPGTKKFK